MQNMNTQGLKKCLCLTTKTDGMMVAELMFSKNAWYEE
jgi:hypothetical protein